MPLKPGKENIPKNIKELIASGKPQKQSVAIAISASKKKPSRKLSDIIYLKDKK